MNYDDLKQYSENFHADVASNAQAMDMLREHSFVEKISEILVDFGETGNSFEPSHYVARGMKVDGYDFDDEYTELTLVISYWLDECDPAKARVPNSEVNRQLKRGLAFFLAALKGGLADRIEVSNPASELALLIHECRKSLLSVKIVLVTDGITDQREAVKEIYDDIEIKNIIWDISRFYTFERTGIREQITIDFEAKYGGAIPCIARESREGQYITYLAFIPGAVLADLYGDWKIRLLERNVRVFLSQRPALSRLY